MLMMLGGGLGSEQKRHKTDDEKNKDPNLPIRTQALEILKKLTIWLRTDDNPDLSTGKMTVKKK